MTKKRILARAVLRVAAIGIGLTAVSTLYHYVIRVNSTTGALTFLLVVLASATFWGLPEALLASAWSMILLDYYFLPPVPALGIDDPQNWVAWCSFLITSFVVSELSARLKKRAREATQRQFEIERLYALSCSLMQGGTAAAIAQRIPEEVAGIFGCAEVAFFDRASGHIHRAGAAGQMSDQSLIDATGDSYRTTNDIRQTIIRVRLGNTVIGSLGFGEGAAPSTPTIHAIANLTALAVDRARKRDAAGQAEAARRHQELKSMLLDALAHEFQTPLTSIRAGIDAMLADSPGRDQQEWLQIMNEESGRLSAMMAEAIQMARIEAGHVDLDKQTHTVDDLVYSALEKEVADSQVEIDLPLNLPPVSADAGLIRLVIRQLAGNALKYSQPGTTIRLRADAKEGGVVISVADRGPGIPPEEQQSIFEKYYRGKQGRGHLTGMGMGLPIARQVVEAHDGRIWVESRPGQGATFFFTLPYAHEEANV
ncbi:MAG TPA: ATP-binding protein [Bryobacteraceae bacterium]|nr:ATP-binding protein [Bryobacteraceae bacterium]